LRGWSSGGIFLGCVLGLLSGTERVAAAETPEQALLTSLKGEPVLMLRSYSAESQAMYEWVGNDLQAAPPKLLAFTSFQAASVQIKKGWLDIVGQGTIVCPPRQGCGPATATRGSKVTLFVNLHGTAPDVVLPQLTDKLFYKSQAEAFAGQPGEWRDRPGDRRGASNPAVLHTKDPEFSEEARKAKIGGTVLVMFRIGADGKVVEPVWILRGLGYGLEAKAAEAVSGYLFRPAMRDGQPISTILHVDVNFQIF